MTLFLEIKKMPMKQNSSAFWIIILLVSKKNTNEVPKDKLTEGNLSDKCSNIERR